MRKTSYLCTLTSAFLLMDQTVHRATLKKHDDNKTIKETVAVKTFKGINKEHDCIAEAEIMRSVQTSVLYK